jgi:DNA-binding NarL/FixJ family response regulator
MKRVLILADGAVTTQRLRAGMGTVPGWTIVGDAVLSQACQWVVSSLCPDLVLVNDAGQPETTLERIREVRDSAPEATIVCRSPYRESTWAYAAAEAGANATLDTSVELVGMGPLIREIAAGSVFCLPRAERRAVPRTDVRLTTRELQILRLMAAGATNGSVARELWVTEQTVKFHLSNIYRKLGVANRTEASHFAHTHGLLATSAAGLVAA